MFKAYLAHSNNSRGSLSTTWLTNYEHWLNYNCSHLLNIPHTIFCKTESINTNSVRVNDISGSSRCFLSHLFPSLLIQQLHSSAQRVDGLFESTGANDFLQVFQHAFVMLRLAFGLHHRNLLHFSLMKRSSHTHTQTQFSLLAVWLKHINWHYRRLLKCTMLIV